MLWQPQAGPQSLLLSCPIPDALFGGARGGGKTDAFIGMHLLHQHRYGEAARGLFIRRSYPELEPIITRCREIYGPAGAIYKEKDRTFYFPEGGTVRMRFLEKDSDAQKFQGHEYTLITVDEAGAFPDPAPLDKIRATLRSSKGVPCLIRLSANPGGPGHGWLKARYIDPADPMVPFRVPFGNKSIERVFIPSKLSDNKILTANDPDYDARLYSVGSESLVKAWLDGDWNVTLGQYFTEWNPDVHVIPEAEVPRHWTRFRAFDWGSKTPFCVLWFAVSDGTPIGLRSYPPGSLIVYREWYGAKKGGAGLELSAEEVATGILLKDAGDRIDYSVADYQIFRADGGPSIAEVMRRKGVFFRAADKERKAGWQQLRQRLKGEKFGTTEHKPMLYVMSSCPALIRTMPQMQHAENDQEDVMKHKGIEDHAPETCRYGCMSRPYARYNPFPSRQRGYTPHDLRQNFKKAEMRLDGY